MRGGSRRCARHELEAHQILYLCADVERKLNTKVPWEVGGAQGKLKGAEGIIIKMQPRGATTVSKHSLSLLD